MWNAVRDIDGCHPIPLLPRHGISCCVPESCRAEPCISHLTPPSASVSAKQHGTPVRNRSRKPLSWIAEREARRRDVDKPHTSVCNWNVLFSRQTSGFRTFLQRPHEKEPTQAGSVLGPFSAGVNFTKNSRERLLGNAPQVCGWCLNCVVLRRSSQW